MREITMQLLTKKEAETYCKRVYSETKIVPVTLCEDGKCTTYYTVYVQLINKRWVPAQNIKPEQVRE